MRIAYLDCFSGISGDMCLAALIDAGASLRAIQTGIDSLQLDARLSVNSERKHAFRGLGLHIDHPEQHAHRNLMDIHAIVRRGQLRPIARGLALRIFERIAKAEAKVHGTTIDRVTFHEVGAIDSIVDIVGIAIAWEELGIERAVASPVPTGTGHIQIAHGTVAIPAPATAELLTDVPIAQCSIPMEMTTPTGAAVIRELVNQFGPLPPMQVGRIGYGAGTRDLEDRPNLLRILIGESLPERLPSSSNSVLILETNLDDTTGEQIGYAVEQLFQAGALDVFTVPIYMKKNRPGTLLTVIANAKDQAIMEALLFKHTGTLGIRHRTQTRTVLPRTNMDVDTPWGVVPGKLSHLPNGEVDFSPEYDACRDIANEEALRLIDVMDEVRSCFYAQESNGNVELDPFADESFAKASPAEEVESSFPFPKQVEEPEDSQDDPQDDGRGLYRWDSAPWKDE